MPQLPQARPGITQISKPFWRQVGQRTPGSGMHWSLPPGNLMGADGGASGELGRSCSWAHVWSVLKGGRGEGALEESIVELKVVVCGMVWRR